MRDYVKPQVYRVKLEHEQAVIACCMIASNKVKGASSTNNCQQQTVALCVTASRFALSAGSS